MVKIQMNLTYYRKLKHYRVKRIAGGLEILCKMKLVSLEGILGKEEAVDMEEVNKHNR